MGAPGGKIMAEINFQLLGDFADRWRHQFSKNTLLPRSAKFDTPYANVGQFVVLLNFMFIASTR